jgi:transposase
LYSPDLNPIEMVFATIKSILRKMARAVEELREALGSIVNCVTAAGIPRTSYDTPVMPSQGENA